MGGSICRFTNCTPAGVHACHIASQGPRGNRFRRTIVTILVKPQRFRRANILYCAMEIKKTLKQSLAQKWGSF